MNKIISKFNVYDQMGYILVGLYQIIFSYSLFLFFQGKDFSNVAGFFDIKNSILVIFSSYFIGHVIQAVTNILVKEKKNEKNNDLDYIFENAREFFVLPKKIKTKDIFQYCYLVSLSNDFSGHVSLFNSMYSLYRGLFVSSAIHFFSYLTVAVLALIFGYVLPIWIYLVILFSLIVTLLFYNRKERFFKYFGEKVLISFDILSKKKF